MHVALVGRANIVEQVWLNTRAASLDASAYHGRLVETEGDIAPGMRLVDGVFLASPPRVQPKALAAEIKRRGDDLFPAGVREMLARVGGEAAVAVQTYVQEVARVGQAMLLADEIPQDYRDDRHWPRVPSVTMPVPVAATQLQPHSVTVAPVINVTPGVTDVTREVTKVIENQGPATVQRDAARDARDVGEELTPVASNFCPKQQVAVVSEPVSPQAQSLTPTDGNDKFRGHGSLDGLKAALLAAADTAFGRVEPKLSLWTRKRFKDGLAALTAAMLAERDVEGVEAAAGRMMDYIEGRA